MDHEDRDRGERPSALRALYGQLWQAREELAAARCRARLRDAGMVTIGIALGSVLVAAVARWPW